MGNFFGLRRRVPLVTAQDRAILQLKQQRDKIRIYQKKTETDLEKNKDLALQLFENGLKDRALIVLRRKKCMEDILSRTDKQLETLEQLVSDIEFTQVEVSVVQGLKVGTEALKQLNSLMNIDDIQQMMEDNEEAADKQKQISDILQRTSERYDEDELLQELEGYKEKDQIQEPAQELPQTSDMVETKDTERATEMATEEAPEKASEEVPEKATEDATEKVTEGVSNKIDDLPEIPKHVPIEETSASATPTKSSPERVLEAAQ